MKKWLFLAAVLTAVAVLSRRPHPARDVAMLEPVEVVWLHMEGDELAIETDTGARGTGKTLTEAAADMNAAASGEIFLDTAEFLILDPAVSVTDDLFTLLRPTCRVTFTTAAPDLEKAAAYLRTHAPTTGLSRLRAELTQHSALSTQH